MNHETPQIVPSSDLTASQDTAYKVRKAGNDGVPTQGSPRCWQATDRRSDGVEG